jgi:hypothetical protein
MKEIFQKILEKVKGKLKMQSVSAKEVVLETPTKMPEYKTTVSWHKKEDLNTNDAVTVTVPALVIEVLSTPDRQQGVEAEAFKQSIRDSNKHQEICETAYFLWEKAGRPDGKDTEFWAEAEKIVSRKNFAEWVLPKDETIILCDGNPANSLDETI